MRRTAGQGLLNSINHPLLHPWKWLDAQTDLRQVQCVEVWNDPSWADNATANPAAVALWTDWLNAGHRITAIGGSDFHRLRPAPGQTKPPERLGLPRTWVYAEALSGAAILAALRQSRAYVSMGPQVSFRAQAGGKTVDIGAEIGKLDGEIEFAAAAQRAARLKSGRNWLKTGW